jgi:hypothetical protein
VQLIRTRQVRTRQQDSALRWVRRGIWLYLWLLIFDGALRKWVVPHSTSGVIALSRDPVAIAIYWFAYRSHTINGRGLMSIVAIGIAMMLLAGIQVMLGIVSIPIMLYGLRSYVLHLPLIPIMRQALTAEDVRKVGRFFMLLSVPMLLLVVAQFRAPPNAPLNAGAGENSGQIETANGHIRPAGSFSFGTGTAEFYPLVLAFATASYLRGRKYPRTLASVAVCAAILVIPFTGSRGLLFAEILIAISAFFAVGRNIKILIPIAGILIIFGLAAITFFQFSVTQEALATFVARWQQAKGDDRPDQMAADRSVKPIFDAIIELENASLIGQGLGLGSSYAASLRHAGGRFLLAESEVPRLIEEAGLLGLVFFAFRFVLGLQIVVVSYRVAARSALPFLLAAATVPNLILAPMEQPTSLGFIIFGSGLVSATASRELKRHSRLRSAGRRIERATTFKDVIPQAIA